MNSPDDSVPDGTIVRAAPQQRITAIESRVRRRIRGKFGAIAGGIYNLDDVMASARRHIDRAVLRHKALPTTDEQLCAYVLRSLSTLPAMACAARTAKSN